MTSPTVDRGRRDSITNQPIPMRMLGHVTSRDWSPNCERAIAVARVADGRALLARTLHVTTPEGLTAVTVVDPVFFDPKGSASMLEVRYRTARALDLGDATVPGGSASRTLLGKAEIVPIRRPGTPPRHRVECRRSFSTSGHVFLVEAGMGTASAPRAA